MPVSTYICVMKTLPLHDLAGRTHSPLAGQGANGAMTDGWNLGMEFSYVVEAMKTGRLMNPSGWKLAYVLRGHASPSILDTYEEERRAHAQQLIQFDREMFQQFRGDTFTSEGYFKYVIRVLPGSQED